jgi:hypothetical protein
VQDINSGYIQANMANSGNYIVSQYAVRMHLDSALGEITFLNAPSGTAGNAVSLTSVLKITASGNVGIGTTSPSQKLEVVGGEIKAGRVDSTNEGGQVSFGRASDNATAWYIDSYGNSSSTELRFVNVSTAAVAMTIAGSNLQVSGQLSANDSIRFRKLTYSTIANGASETQTIIAAQSGAAFRSLQVVVFYLDAPNAAISQLKFDLIARWQGSTIQNTGLGNIDGKYSRGINDFTGTGNLVPSVGTSGNAVTLTLTNAAGGNITNIVVNITENYSN